MRRERVYPRASCATVRRHRGARGPRCGPFPQGRANLRLHPHISPPHRRYLTTRCTAVRAHRRHFCPARQPVRRGNEDFGLDRAAVRLGWRLCVLAEPVSRSEPRPWWRRTETGSLRGAFFLARPEVSSCRLRPPVASCTTRCYHLVHWIVGRVRAWVWETLGMVVVSGWLEGKRRGGVSDGRRVAERSRWGKGCLSLVQSGPSRLSGTAGSGGGCSHHFTVGRMNAPTGALREMME